MASLGGRRGPHKVQEEGTIITFSGLLRVPIVPGISVHLWGGAWGEFVAAEPELLLSSPPAHLHSGKVWSGDSSQAAVSSDAQQNDC